ncbi:MAG: DEAD/DEAH box helicase [Deltaproteobacteria bacterium]|nr:DEAD/DEAH box helicase [Deltaproteobacteria bacterium]
MPSVGIPNQGQIVTARARKWVVLDVHKSALPPDVMAGVESARPQHLVSLSSVEEDGLGEELHVIWEVEAGTAISERSTLPEPKGFDEPRRLDAFLNAVRWGAVSSADVKALHAPFRSGIQIEDYQLDPVVRALQMPRVNLLVADDVGLGKSVESGLVVQELMLRHRARTVLVVCPAALQIHWKTILWEKFGLEFRIVDAELIKWLRRRRGVHVNPWNHFPRLITSIDYIKRDRPFRLFRETLPAKGQPSFPRHYDVLIVDEAHNVAPSGMGRYAIDSQRTQVIREITPHFEHKLFLTATPHSGFTEAFTALLELIDDQRFHRGLHFDKEQLAAVMVRRLKSELKTKWDGTPRFPPRKLDHIEVEYTDAERRAHADLAGYTALRQRNTGDNAERFATEFVLKMLKKRLFSSPAAFASTLEKHAKSIGRATKAKAEHRVSVGVLRRQAENIEEAYSDDDEYEDAAHDLVETGSRLFRDLEDDERRLLDSLRKYATSAKGRPDSKAQRLIDWLNSHLRPNGKWNDERVIIFTEFRTTQKYLQTLFAAEGLSTGERLLTLYGGMPGDDRERIKAAFQASPKDSPVRILLGTDAASEGIDLQNHCHRLIHYEIPWNPARMEQRNGRVDRHGQRAGEVLIFHFAPKGFDAHAYDQKVPVGKLEGDIEFLTRAAIKVEHIREDLGNVGPVITQQVEEAMLGRRQGLDTGAAERQAAEKRREYKVERDLRKQLEKLFTQLNESREELKMSPENVRAVVEVGLQVAGKPPLGPVEVEGLRPASSGANNGHCAFAVPPLDGTWAACATGLAHPHTGKVRPIVFDHDLAVNRDDVVLAHLNHRLVEMCLRLLRAEVWVPEGQQKLNRVSARLASKSVIKEPVVVGYGRLLVLGADNARLHEEIITAAGALREGRFARLNVGDTDKAIGAALDAEAPAAVKERLIKLWPSHRDALVAALDARMKERTGGLLKSLGERRDKEVADITAILSELKRSIEEELRHKPEQQELFSSVENDQFERNKDALRARLEAIPAELERETGALRKRYSEPTPRLFPVAVMYLVPENLVTV